MNIINYRPDIDGLRALAIILVVFYHALPSFITGGFIGVDIFFVISGFLISRIIFKEISVQGFSFLRFYARRANRIFPALIFVLVSCWLFGWVSLLAVEYAELGKYTAAGAWFVSNIISWLDAGYFDTASEKKPLLHLWSLGVEEQFYLVWPIIMFVGARFKIKLPVLIFIIALVSFIFNVTNVNENPESSFFLPYSRFWELLIGASLAYLYSCDNNVIGNFLEKIPNLMSILGIIQIIVAVVLIDSQIPFPGYYALLPTVGAVFLIASPKSFISRKILSSKFLVGIGLISYPLYLWHWPLLAFSRIIHQKPLEPTISLSIIVLSFIMAFLTYRLIELPIKEWQLKTKPIYLFIMLSAIGGLGLVTYYQAGIPSRNAVKDKSLKSSSIQILNNYKTECPFVVGFYKDCYFFTDAQHTERVLLIGDSHAGHLIPGLAEYIKRGDLRLGA